MKEKREESVKRAYETELQGLLDGDSQKYNQLLDKDFWLELSSGLSISDREGTATLAAIGADTSSTRPDRTTAAENLKLLLNRGFCGVEGIDWAAHGVDFSFIAQTMENLKLAGWPPVFVFMYDEAWRVCEALFDVIAVSDKCSPYQTVPMKVVLRGMATPKKSHLALFLSLLSFTHPRTHFFSLLSRCLCSL